MKRGFLTQRTARKPTKKQEATRNWLDLPRDVMIHIFLKLGVIDLLYNAQSVCSIWRKLAKEPQLYRCIDMRNPWNHFTTLDIVPVTKMLIEAINRSCGQLVEFSIVHFGNNEVLKLIVEKPISLRCLCIASCFKIAEDSVIQIVEKSPLLEELELCHCQYTLKVIEVAGHSCPMLKSFRLNHRADTYYTEYDNDEAFSIATNFPNLRRLHMFGNMVDNNGLRAILKGGQIIDKNGLQTILKGCLHLEYLDLRQCFNIDMDEDMLKKMCEGIKTLRLPKDSTDDYEFQEHIVYFDEDPESDLHSDGSDGSVYEDFGC